MSAIVIVDSSVLLNIIDVPDRNQRRGEVLNRLGKLIEGGDHLFIPMAAIVEVGNHIAHVKNGAQRRSAARRFVKEVRSALADEAPWKPINFPSNQEVPSWLDAFPESATKGVGMGDLSIRKEWEFCCRQYSMSHVWVWTLDGDLAGLDCPAFGFVADCLSHDVESACDMKQRGGFERLRSMGSNEAIRFEIYYREATGERPMTYELAIALDETGRPFVESEVLKQRRKGQKHGRPYPFLRLQHGKGMVWAGEEAVETKGGGEDRAQEPVELTDLRQLGIATLGTLKEHPRIKRFRDFLKGWYLSYFYPDAARSLPSAGPQKHLNSHGDNIGNVVQFMEREHKDRFKLILKRIAAKIPGVKSIDTEVTIDKRVVLRFNDGAFDDPFYAQQMSDGTLKVFAYLLLMEDPDPPPFICIEEPENGLYHKLLEALAQEFRAHATGKKSAPQIFVTTHQPYFVDALSAAEVWILEKGVDGYSAVRRVSDLVVVSNLVAEGLPLGGLWYSDYIDAR